MGNFTQPERIFISASRLVGVSLWGLLKGLAGVAVFGIIVLISPTWRIYYWIRDRKRGG